MGPQGPKHSSEAGWRGSGRTDNDHIV